MSSYSLIDFLTLVGSIGLFLYGMKLMSEGLQKIAGDSLRNVLAAMTNNRFTGMLTGIVVTALVQSSSATTVMIVSFVNAGLITLAESMAVIMGANVGTTATTWIIAVFGFKFNIATYVLPLIAISLPFFNSSHSKRNSWGEFIIGFALLFLGLEVLKQSVPDLSSYPAALQFMRDYSSMGYGSIFLFLLIGMVLTMIVQASSAAFTIALLMCTNGWISFEMGCAFILGAKIGTCITPLLASLSANTMAKRAAMGHLSYNIVCAIWALALYYPFCDFITWLCCHLGFGDPHDIKNVSMGMTMYHTTVSVVHVCLMIGFTKQYVKLVSRLIPEKQAKDEAFKLQYLDKGLIASGELSLLQVRKEAHRYAEEVYKMFGHIRTMMNEPLGSEKQLELYMKVKKLEQDSDVAENEIANFLNQINPKSLSYESELLSRRLYKMVDELESIADSIFHLACTLKEKSEQRVYFTDKERSNVGKMISLTDAALVHMLKCMEKEELPESSLMKAYNYEDEINNFRAQLRNDLLERTDTNKDLYLQTTYYMDLVNECEKVGDYVINVLTTMS
jgi:phosphate:Na+ symporter